MNGVKPVIIVILENLVMMERLMKKERNEYTALIITLIIAAIEATNAERVVVDIEVVDKVLIETETETGNVTDIITIGEIIVEGILLTDEAGVGVVSVSMPKILFLGNLTYF